MLPPLPLRSSTALSWRAGHSQSSWTRRRETVFCSYSTRRKVLLLLQDCVGPHTAKQGAATAAAAGGSSKSRTCRLCCKLLAAALLK
jgi:hypothetical protein